MSQQVLSNLDLTGHQLLNAKVQLLASDPPSPANGDFWINTTSWLLKYRINGVTLSAALGPITSAMIEDGTIVQGDLASALVTFLTSRANHSGSQTASTISDFNSAAVSANASAISTASTNDRARANHTGTQLAATISDFASAAEAALAANLATNATNDRARANHTGTQLAATISDFDTAVRTSRLDQMAAPTGPLSVNNQRITNVADGVGAQDAATVAQVQAAAGGLDAKPSVRAASVANIALTGAQTIDGIALVAGNRVLLKNQTAPAENGIWVVAAGAWARAADMDTWAEVPGAFVFVEEGTVNGDSGWLSTANSGGTLGTTAITWTKFVAASASVLTKWAGNITGDGSTTQFTVTHSLGTTDVGIHVYDVTADAEVIIEKKRPSNDTARIDFGLAPALNKVYRVVVIG